MFFRADMAFDWLIGYSQEGVKYCVDNPSFFAWNCCYVYSQISQLRATELSKMVGEARLLIEDTITKQGSLSPEYIKYFKNRQSKGVPYINFTDEPYHVSLVKEIINSLYHGEQAAIIFEAKQVPNYIAVGYLIKSYSNEGDCICDFTMGSGTTGIACKNLNRKCILNDLNKDVIEIINNNVK